MGKMNQDLMTKLLNCSIFRVSTSDYNQNSTLGNSLLKSPWTQKQSAFTGCLFKFAPLLKIFRCTFPCLYLPYPFHSYIHFAYKFHYESYLDFLSLEHTSNPTFFYLNPSDNTKIIMSCAFIIDLL